MCIRDRAKALQAENHELEGLLDANLRIPAMSLLFNIDSISQKGSKTALMDAFIRVFDDARGYYGANKYVAKLERDLDNNGCLEQFKTEFEPVSYTHLCWLDWRTAGFAVPIALLFHEGGAGIRRSTANRSARR